MLGPRLRGYENCYIASSTSPGHQRLLELAYVSGVSRAFTLSVKLDLYTLLRSSREKEGVEGLTAADVAARLGLKADASFRGVTDWLDLLVSLGLLDRKGGSNPNTVTDSTADSEDDKDAAPTASSSPALYSNTTEADTYLAKQSPDYMGGHAVLYHDRCVYVGREVSTGRHCLS
eukprot:GHUV01025794.1.p1 GENE.GHUV01025794.1~~GHUV01025794.1.p1  ORF type:complete len:175 (+),score=21.89 GHUV01025794.1:352-876(+)